MYKIDITDDLEGVFAYEYGKMMKHYISLPYIKNDSLFLNLENIEFTFGEKIIIEQILIENDTSIVGQMSKNVDLDSPYFDICVILRKAYIEIQHYKNYSLQKKSSTNTLWSTTGLSFLKNDLIFYFVGNSLELLDSRLDVFAVAKANSKIYIHFDEYDIIPFTETRKNHSGIFQYLKNEDIEKINEAQRLTVSARQSKKIDTSIFTANKLICFDYDFHMKYLYYSTAIKDFSQPARMD